MNQKGFTLIELIAVSLTLSAIGVGLFFAATIIKICLHYVW